MYSKKIQKPITNFFNYKIKFNLSYYQKNIEYRIYN